MTATNLMLEDALQLFSIHTLTRIRDGDFHGITCIMTIDGYLTTFWRKLPRIICQGVDHEQRHGLVSLDHIC